MSLVYVDPRLVTLARKLGGDAKLVWMYLVTHPYAQLTPGLLAKPSLASFAEDFGLDLAQARRGMSELVSAGLVAYDEAAGLFRVPAMPNYSAKAAPNHVKGWYRHWKTMPDCQLKYDHAHTLRSVLRGAGTALEAWDATFGVSLSTGVAFSVDQTTSPNDSQLSMFNQQVKEPIRKGSGWDPDPTHPDPDPDPYPDLDPVLESGSSPDPDSPVVERVQESGQVTLPVVDQDREPLPKVETKAQLRDRIWKQVTGFFDLHYADANEGSKPTWNGTPRKLLEPFIQQHGPAEVQKRIWNAFHAPPAWIMRDGGALDVRTFVANFDKFAVPARRATGPPREERMSGSELIELGDAMNARDGEKA